jgi:hypothetical protein
MCVFMFVCVCTLISVALRFIYAYIMCVCVYVCVYVCVCVCVCVCVFVCVFHVRVNDRVICEHGHSLTHIHSPGQSCRGKKARRRPRKH